MLDPTQALAEAQAEALELADDDFWRAAFVGAKPRLPVLVMNLTKPGRDFYLVDFRKGDRSTGRIIIDANTGRANQVTGIEEDAAWLPEFIAPVEVLARVPPEVDLPDGRRIPTGPGAPEFEAVWAHSRESRTMFQPFYRLRWPGRTLYMRIDGTFYEWLTPTMALPPQS